MVAIATVGCELEAGKEGEGRDRNDRGESQKGSDHGEKASHPSVLFVSSLH
jgi:hypothetical protein